MTEEQPSHRAASSAPRDKEQIRVLRNSDVLLGRGKGFSSFTGNQDFLKIIDERRAQYNQTDENTEKTSIARQVMKIVKGRGGRFLRLVNTNKRVKDVVNEGLWCEAADSVAMEKIKQALRQKRASESPNRVNPVSHTLAETGLFPEGILQQAQVLNANTCFLGGGGLPMAAAATPFQTFISLPLSGHSMFLPPPQLLGSLMSSVVDARILLFQRSLLDIQQHMASNVVHPSLVANTVFLNDMSLSSTTIPPADDTLDSTRTAYSNQMDARVASTAVAVPDDGVSESFLSVFGIDSHQPRITEEQAELEKAQMSDSERAAALADLFGKHCSVDSHHPNKRARKDLDADSVDFLVKQMRSEIEMIPLHKKQALINAQAKCSRVEEFSDKRLERFLRCEGMNTKLAAERFVKYWECRRKLFGDDKYMHRMTISEALRDDLDAVQDGVFCLLPIKDSSGRQLLHLEPGRKSDGYSSDSLLRAFWYTAEIMSRENTDISSGIVILAWHPTSTIWSFDRKAYDHMVRFEQTCWPIQCISHHICCPTSVVMRVIKPIVFAFMDARTRTRSVVHDVPENEIANALLEYGIRKEMLPTGMGGTVEIDMMKWTADRRATEMEEL